MPKLKRFLIILSGLVMVAFTLPLAYAQQSPSGSGLSISPTESEFTIKPGGSNALTITLKNITVDTVTARGEVDDFTADNVTGNPKVITDQKHRLPTSISPFVANLDNVVIAKGQQAKQIISLAVPKNTSPGAYYGIIRYRAVPNGTSAPGPGQVSLTASVGTIVLITVPGNIRQQVQVKAIHIYRGAHDGTFFFTKPNKIGVEIDNFGNGFIAPFGNVEVNSMFNKNVATFAFNNPKQLGNILPQSSRIFTQNFSGIKQVGRYTVLASVSYGSGSQVLTVKKVFWYIPVWLVVIIAVIILLLLFLAYRAYHHYRRENRHSSRR